MSHGKGFTFSTRVDSIAFKLNKRKKEIDIKGSICDLRDVDNVSV